MPCSLSLCASNATTLCFAEFATDTPIAFHFTPIASNLGSKNPRPTLVTSKAPLFAARSGKIACTAITRPPTATASTSWISSALAVVRSPAPKLKAVQCSTHLTDHVPNLFRLTEVGHKRLCAEALCGQLLGSCGYTLGIPSDQG